MTLRNDRLESLDIARGIAIVFVVFLHSSSGRSVPHLYESINAVFTGVRMPLLMLIAGLMASRLIDAGRSLAPRAIHFAWLFVIWTAIIWPLQLWSEGSSATPALLLGEFAMPSTILWFVWLLAILTLSLPIVRRAPPTLVIVVAAALSVAQDSGGIDDAIFHHHLVLSSTVFFYLGALYGTQLFRVVQRTPHISLALLIPMIALARLSDAQSVDLIGWKLLELPRHALTVLAVIHASALLGKASLVAAPLNWLGRNTLPIFVMHPLVVIPATLAMSTSASANAFIVPLVVALAICTALLLHRLLLSAGAYWLFAPPKRLCELFTQPVPLRSALSEPAGGLRDSRPTSRI